MPEGESRRTQRPEVTARPGRFQFKTLRITPCFTAHHAAQGSDVRP